MMHRKWANVTKENLLDSIRTGEWKTFIDSILHAGFDINRRIRGYTLLSYAVEYGDRRIVEYLLQKGGNYNVQNGDGTLPLHIASKYCHQDIVELFVNLGVFVDSRDRKNRTPLHCVAEKVGHYRRTRDMSSVICYDSGTHAELVHFLIVNGANLDAVDRENNTPLLIAAKYSCIFVLKMLITRGANIQCCDDKKWTVLHYASFAGWLDVVQSLLERGIDVNAKTLSGDTSLLFATRNSHKKVAKLLIGIGANVHSCDGSKVTVLHNCSRNGWLDMVQLLVNRGSNLNAQTLTGATPLLFAVQHSRRAIYNVLVTSGANSEICDGDKMTVFHYACRAGWLEVVQYFVESGCDINAETLNRDTPLLLAAQYSHKRIVEMLLKLGAIPSCCDHMEWTLLHYACREGWMEVVKSVLKAGFNISAKTIDGETPLFIAAKFSQAAIFDHLVEAGADVNVKISRKSYYERCMEGYDSDKGCYEVWTLLHHASYNGWLEIVPSLIKKGMDVNDKTDEGDTPLHLALKDKDSNLPLVDKRMEIVKHLLKAGADCNEENDEYETAFDYISNFYGVQEIRLFLESGAYISSGSYTALIKRDYFKESILKDVELCTQAVINEFNSTDLHDLYTTLVVEYLPPKEKLKIPRNRNVAQCIEQCVRNDIETNGYCRILELRPIVLTFICVRTINDNY